MASRVALLIGCPGVRGRDGFLPGVTVDIEKYSDYLLSLAGGAWNGREIVRRMNPGRAELVSEIARLPKCDYSLTVFSGHGRMSNRNGRTYLLLSNNEEISVNELITKSDRQLIIVDACRSYPPQELAGDTMIKSAILEHIERDARRDARALFDSHLMRCEHGLSIMYACSVNQAAGEDPDGSGGYFSTALLESCEDWASTRDAFRILPVDVAFQLAEKRIRNFLTTQTPQILNQRRLHSFPFAVKLQ